MKKTLTKIVQNMLDDFFSAKGFSHIFYHPKCIYYLFFFYFLFLASGFLPSLNSGYSGFNLLSNGRYQIGYISLDVNETFFMEFLFLLPLIYEFNSFFLMVYSILEEDPSKRNDNTGKPINTVSWKQILFSTLKFAIVSFIIYLYQVNVT